MTERTSRLHLTSFKKPNASRKNGTSTQLIDAMSFVEEF
jgi:hypothetical protein